MIGQQKNNRTLYHQSIQYELLSHVQLFATHELQPPGSSVHGILQARILQWVSFPSPVDLPDPGIETRSPALQADSLWSEPPGYHPNQDLIEKPVITFKNLRHIRIILKFLKNANAQELLFFSRAPDRFIMSSHV